MDTYWALGIVFVVPIIFRLWRSVRSLRSAPKDPYRFASVGRSWKIYAVTGRVHDVSKGHSTAVSGEISGYSGNVRGSIRSKTTVHDQFFMTDLNGAEHSMQLNDFNVAVANGQIVSVAWAIRRGKKTGRYFLVANHTTGQNFFSNDALYRITINHRLLLWPEMFTVVFLPVFAAMLAWAVCLRLQLRRFKKTGVQPLVNSLAIQASQFPQLGSIRVDELDRLASLARDGLLTDDEWTRAKDLFLGKPPSARTLSLTHLNQIYSLYREGALSESEFNMKKWEILARNS